MSQISRLHSNDIVNGNLIDATHLNNEYNQLVSESNSQDTRLTSVESTVTNHTNSFKSTITGLVVQYNTSNRVLIKPGSCRDDSNTELMEVTSDLTVDISTSGANGLDTGTEAASTWYYVWLIKNTSTGTVAGLFSASSTAPTLPSGYNKKRLLPIAVRNDGSNNFIPFQVGEGWPFKPTIYYDVAFSTSGAVGTTNILNGGAATSFTTVGCGTFVPPISTKAELSLVNNGTVAGTLSVRKTGATHNGKTATLVNGYASPGTLSALFNSSQQFDYSTSTASATWRIDIFSFTVTEV